MKWGRHRPLELKAEFESDYSNPGLNRTRDFEIMEDIQVWCEQNACGRRMAFDLIRFRTEEEITMFLLRWA
jgi:hypothetical protein